MRCSALYAGRARDASCQAVYVNGRAPKIISLGSWDMHSFALRGSVMGLLYMNLFILKQLCNAAYKVSGMSHGSSYSSCCCCFCYLCSFLSFAEVS